MFSDIKHSKAFLDQFPKAIKIEAKINKWDLNKLVSFSTANQKQRQPLDWAKIFENNATDKDLISNICKYLI